MLSLLRRFYVARVATAAGSEGYWKRRYKVGGNSGCGSYGKHATFKAQVLNEFVAEKEIGSVVEFGCGDGHQLTLADYPGYTGFDISERAIELCRARFGDDPTKKFGSLSDYQGERAELSLSLDVIYHLIEDHVFAAHLRTVFGAAERFVIVYSSNTDSRRLMQRSHVRPRTFTRWVDEHAAGWVLQSEVSSPVARRPGSTAASFFVFGRVTQTTSADRQRPSSG